MARRFDLISFDFDGVILHTTFNDFYLETLRTLGVRWQAGNERKLFRYFHDYWASDLSGQESAAAPSREAFFHILNRRFLEMLEAEGELDEVTLQMVARFTQFEQEVTYFHETILYELLDTLASQGYRIVMITNRGRSVETLLDEWDLRDYFEIVVTRETAGKQKPNREPFDYVNKQLQIPPHRCLHIGDSPYSDVKGANNAGWTPLLLDLDDLFPDWEVERIRSLQELAEYLQLE